MTQLHWTVESEKAAHTVTLEYSFWTCRHRLLIDDQIVYDRRVLREFGAEVDFQLDGHKGTLFVDVPGRLTFDHYLTVEGCPVKVRAESKPNLLPYQMDTSNSSASQSIQ